MKIGHAIILAILALILIPLVGASSVVCGDINPYGNLIIRPQLSQIMVLQG